MACENLTFYSSLASISSLGITIFTLFYVRSLKKNIVRFRRRQRLTSLINEIKNIPTDATPFSQATKAKLKSLSDNVDVSLWWFFSKKGKAAKRLCRSLAGQELSAIVEAIEDWISHRGDL